MKNKKYKGFYNIVKDQSKREATILIYGVIGGFDWDSWTYINTSDKFVEEFKQVESEADIIHIRINSPGGNVHDGLPIYNTIKNSEKTIYTYVDGIAYSMASLIALAGDKVYGYSNSLFMVHNASTYFFGNANDIREEAKVLDKYDLALGSIIEEKLNISSEDVSEKFLNYKDNYFVGKEAKAEGFFDEIITSNTDGAPEDVKDMSPKDVFQHYAKMNFNEETPSPVPDPKQNAKKTTKMNNKYNALEAVLNTTFEVDDTKNGVLLSEEEAGKVDSKISDLQTELQTVTDAKKLVDDTISANTVKNTAIVDEVNTVLELEGDAKVTDVATAFTAMKNQIAELGKQPGETPTNLGENKQEDTEAMPEYVDLESSIYKIK